MNNLQKSLTANAVFSTLSALSLLIFTTRISVLFEIGEQWPFLIIGFGLLVFVATIIIEIKKQRKKAVYAIIIQDLLWVLGSIILLIIQPFGISKMGNILIAVVAFAVLIFAILQYKGIQELEIE